MSSYYKSFSCVAPDGKRYNSFKDKNLIVVHFESGDDGEVDTFLGMDPIYTDNAYGTRRIDYGAKYNNVAVIRISVMKANGEDFTGDEVRDFLRWTTGSRKISYLDLSDIIENEEIIKVSFLGRVTAVYQQKLDARTVGFVVEHTSISPYAYSPIQNTSCSFGKALSVTSDGIVYKDGRRLTIMGNGLLTNGDDIALNITDNGYVYIDDSTRLIIDNNTDDLSDYVYIDTVFTSVTSSGLTIKNETLYEKSDGSDGITEITDMHNGEVITLSSNNFIISSAANKTFGNSFNFVWPKLLPGENSLFLSGTGEGNVKFTYRTPMKIGDCAIDTDVSGAELLCNE